MMPALHISTSMAGWSYAAANDETDDRSCQSVEKEHWIAVQLQARTMQLHTLRSMMPKETLAWADEAEAKTSTTTTADAMPCDYASCVSV